MSERQAKLARRKGQQAANRSVRATLAELVRPRPWWLPRPVWWWLIGLLLNVAKPRGSTTSRA